VAAHPMGLGRHRSTRHGMISKRQARASSSAGGATGAWITRQQAADRAGVHYNTVRQWERTGVLRRGSQPGARETLVSAADVDRLAATRGGKAAAGSGSSGDDASRLAALERSHRELADGLERLAGALRASVGMGASRAQRSTPANAGGAKRAASKRRTAKRGPAKRAAAKRATPKRQSAGRPSKRSTAKRGGAKRSTGARRARTAKRR